MGNSSGLETKTAQDVFQGYQLMGVEDNDRFGDVSLYKDMSNGDIVWVKDVPIEDKKMEEELDRYIIEQAWKDPVFITRNIFKVAPQEGFFCSANCHITPRYVIFMDYHERDLEYEIEQRAIVKEYFPEPEIWYIIESIMSVQSVVLRQNRFHGDLKTSNIFISQDGQTKFGDPIILDHKTNSYLKVFMSKTKCNLSPEYFHSLHSNHREPQSNPELTDVFAMGIIILSLASLHDDTWYYDWRIKDLLWSNIRDSLSELGMRYSPLLYRLADGCLKLRVADRVPMSEVLRFMDERKKTAN